MIPSLGDSAYPDKASRRPTQLKIPQNELAYQNIAAAMTTIIPINLKYLATFVSLICSILTSFHEVNPSIYTPTEAKHSTPLASFSIPLNISFSINEKYADIARPRNASTIKAWRNFRITVVPSLTK